MIPQTLSRPAALLLIIVVPLSADAQSYRIETFSTRGAASTGANGTLSLTGTIGEPTAHLVSGGDFELRGGFWNASLTVEKPPGLEGDVAPRYNGDNSLTISDWVQVGRFVVGLDDIKSQHEFRRADTAPRGSGDTLERGNGDLSIADWVQTGRCVIGLDSVPAGGGPAPNSGTFTGMSLATQPKPKAKISLGKVDQLPGSPVVVPIEMETLADQAVSAFAFSIQFEPKLIRFVHAKLLNGESERNILLNERSIHAGKLGLAIASLGKPFPRKNHMIGRLHFDIRNEANAMKAQLQIVDEPVSRALSTQDGVDVTGLFEGVAFVIEATKSPSLSFSRATGPGLRLHVQAEPGQTTVVEESGDLIKWHPIDRRTVPLTGHFSLSIEGNLEQAGAASFYRVRKE